MNIVRWGRKAVSRCQGLLFRTLRFPFPRAKGIHIGSDLRLRGWPCIRAMAGSRIEIGDRVTLLSSPTSNAVGLCHPTIIQTLSQGALIRIGDDCGLSGVAIVARKEILIGNDVLLGAGCKILDNDFHPIDAEERRLNAEGSIQAEGIVIEDKVWVGGGATILKGVRLGEGCVVGASAVVTKSIPAHSVAAGNPARVIRMLKQSEPHIASDD